MKPAWKVRAAPLLLLVAAGCAEAAPPPRCSHAKAPAAAAAGVYRYRVSVSPDAEQLCVEVDVPRGAAATWTVTPPVRPYLRDVLVSRGGAPEPVAAGDGGWSVPACGASGCSLRYRFLLGAAARAVEQRDYALEHRGAFLAPPSSWLLHPVRSGAPFQVQVETPRGVSFVTGLARAPGDPATYQGDIAGLNDTPYAIFGPLSVRTLALPGGSLDVAVTAGDLALPRGELDGWIDASARAMASYYGRFPIDHAALLVLLDRGRGASNGHTMGYGGGAVLLSIGANTRRADLADDWLLVHEMVHLSFPNVGRAWAEEGIATYLEPIIRVRAGLLPADEVWSSMIEGLPKGLPGPGDQGLDHTDTWGRRYWGGALFWFLADVEIRRRTENRRSLDDALRAINQAGGNVSTVWDLDRALEVGDRAAGVEVLRPLRRRLGEAPVNVDLGALFRDLGVALRGGRVVYDDAAPSATIRARIVAKGG